MLQIRFFFVCLFFPEELVCHHTTAVLMVKEEKKKIKVKEAPPKSDIFYVISLFSPSPRLRSSQNGQRPPSPLATNTCLRARAEPCPRPSHTWMPISVKLNFFPEAFPVYSVRTTCFSKLLISNMYFSAPRFMLSLPLVNSGFLPWGTLIHYKLSMNWIYVHFFSDPSKSWADTCSSVRYLVSTWWIKMFISTSLPTAHLSLAFMYLQF